MKRSRRARRDLCRAGHGCNLVTVVQRSKAPSDRLSLDRQLLHAGSEALLPAIISPKPSRYRACALVIATRDASGVNKKKVGRRSQQSIIPCTSECSAWTSITIKSPKRVTLEGRPCLIPCPTRSSGPSLMHALMQALTLVYRASKEPKGTTKQCVHRELAVDGSIDSNSPAREWTMSLATAVLNQGLEQMSLKPETKQRVRAPAQQQQTGLLGDFTKRSKVAVIYMCFERMEMIHRAIPAILGSEGLAEFDFFISQDGSAASIFENGTVSIPKGTQFAYIRHPANLCTGLHHHFVKAFAFNIMGLRHSVGRGGGQHHLHPQALQAPDIDQEILAYGLLC
ncbi:hypothetical protein VOLCADRAFT_88173 [Volvox carteri f. nagariensis]|uniref:Uncharacterized protein n=1 Tax=Volvox carteri f. nagariensis TaxID=3068 RepID=D8TNG8_VOLCA|nr:uncharacterized protein VOLCADRAFT_88173 [Volvox carteri f. nagariensis]EFJ50837.1 hypothetical protein VOLCADRAFT_88173 [Volvox carteri f. nagariensis]|eukprot:XP_002947849.1 hypothetical protein VOLCADRAFT_88173 [Volvox carteri f. nagariensis]